MMEPICHAAVFSPPIWFLTAFGCFYLAAHRQPGDPFRHVLGMLSILGVATAGYLRGQQPDRESGQVFILVMLSIAVFLRTFTLIFWKGFFLEAADTRSLFDTYRLRNVFVFWTTLITDKSASPPTIASKKEAGEHPVDDITNSNERDKTSTRTPTTTTHDPTSLPLFIARSCDRLLFFWILDQITTHLITSTFLELDLTLDDFVPHKQTLLPPSDALNAREMRLRAIMSVNWIRATYLSLSILREALAILHVAVLRVESPESWTARSLSSLYGSPAEAYTLRRFWGVFWHRLHVETLAAYTPPFMWLVAALLPARWRRFLVVVKEDDHDDGNDAAAGAATLRSQKRPKVVTMVEKTLSAGWIFFSSSLCHAVTMWVLTGRSHTLQQARFFLLNWVVCLLETVIGDYFFDKSRRGASVPVWKRMLGYIWVFGVFFALTPAWQYSTVYDSVLDSTF